MAPTVRIKDYRSEQQLFSTRAIQAVIVAAVLLAILVGRLVFLQIIQHDAFVTRSIENRVKLVAIPPTRGMIFDRNGILLAGNRPAYSLQVTPEHITDIEDTLHKISRLIPISEVERDRFYKIKPQRPSFEGIPLRLRMSDEEVARIAVNQYQLPGVDIVARLTRYYPQEQHAPHVVGYVGRISEKELREVDAASYRGTSHIGKSGIEKHYEDVLQGTVGMQQVEINARGRILRKLQSIASKPGKNLYLTLDSRLQHIAEDAMGENSGAVVAIEPQSGEVLVFASRPGYDPNLFVNGIDHKSYRTYIEDESRPLYNRALYGRYPPGSTVKPFVALAGLETDVIEHDHETHCPGFYQLPNSTHKYRCWKKNGHGTVDLNKSLVESCDVFYYELARALKVDRLRDYMVLFGFGEKTGIDLLDTQYEPSGLFPSTGWKRRTHQKPWYPGETLIAGIGQGFTLSTPLQLASATATLANRGVRVTPRLTREIETARTDERRKIPVERGSNVPITTKDHWDQVIKAMQDVVHSPHGTARHLGNNIAYTIAGKTGTAQVIGIKQEAEYDEREIAKRLQDHALFIAFAPVENPQIAVAVVVENGGSGGTNAAPVAGKIIKAWLTPKIESGELIPETVPSRAIETRDS